MKNINEIIYNISLWEISFEIFKTFLAFTFGLLSNFLINHWTKKNKSRKMREFYISWVEFSLESFERQLVLLSNHILEISESKPLKLIFNNNQIDKLNSINNEELFDAFVLRNKGSEKINAENLHRLGSHIEFLVISTQELKLKLNETKINKENWNNEWNVKWHELDRIIYEFISYHKNSDRVKVNDILEVKDKFNIKNNYNLDSTEYILINFITPIKNIFDFNFNNYDDKLSKEGIIICENLYSLFLKKEHLYSKYKESIIYYKSQIRYTIDKINGIIKYFNK